MVNPGDKKLLIKKILAKQPNLQNISSLKEYYSITGPNTQTDKGNYYNTNYAPQALVINCYIIIDDPVTTYQHINKTLTSDIWQQVPTDSQRIINELHSGEALFTTEYYLEPEGKGKYPDYREDLSFFTFRNIPDAKLKKDICEMKGLSKHMQQNTNILETYTTLDN